MKRKIILVGVFLLLALTAFLFWPRSSKKVPDADLQFVRVNVPENENAFFTLLQVTNLADFSEEQKNVIYEIHQNKSWDSNQVSELLNEYGEAIDLLEKALEMPRVQVPEPVSFVYLDECPYVSDWKTFARLELLKAKFLFRSGNESEGFKLAIRIVRFGHAIENSDGGILHYLVGVAVKTIGFRLIREMSAVTTLPCENLREYQKQLFPYSVNETGLTNAVKLEYQLQVNSIPSLRSGNFPGATNSLVEKAFWSVLHQPLLNEQKTKELFATVARAQLKSIPLTLNLMPTNLLPVAQTNIARLLLGGNAMGDVLTRMTLPAQEKAVGRKCRENNELAATKIILALRCYQMKNGSLPPSLDKLVPEFLAAIPADDFDGKPFRYIPDKKIIYSVGQDLIDSNGQKENGKHEPLDIPFPIEF